MTKEIIERLMWIKNVIGKTVIISAFYAGSCLLISVFNVQFAILLTILGIIGIMIMFVCFYGAMIEIQLIAFEEIQKGEDTEKENKWRSKMKEDLENE